MAPRARILILLAAWAGVTGGLELPRVALALYGPDGTHTTQARAAVAPPARRPTPPAPTAPAAIAASAVLAVARADGTQAPALCGDGAGCRLAPQWPAWPPGILPPWADADPRTADLLSGTALVRAAAIYQSGAALIDEGGATSLTLGTATDAIIQSLLGTHTATGPLTIYRGSTGILSGWAGASIEVQEHARLYVTGDWAPATDAVLSVANGYTAGLIVVAGTLTRPAGGTLTVSGYVRRLPQRLVAATALSGTWAVGSLPAGTQIRQTATDIYLEAAP